ncbi:MAG TPA: hypothetical protein VK960_02155 [Acidimicrobiia bacterium]|nr:hypothetical protein [Acidimicrobiia bacterium]
MVWVIIGLAVVAIVVVVLVTRSRSSSAPSSAGGVSVESSDRLRPAVAEFHVTDGAARVHFEVPLPDESDEVLEDLLGREAVEVVREKRHSLPIDDVSQVVAFGRRAGEWAVAKTISLDTPGELPPPILPELLPHGGRDIDVFDHISTLPQTAPGIDVPTKGEELPPFAGEVRLPGSASAALRAQGVDPTTATGPEIALGLMRAGGYMLEASGPDTYRARREGQATFVRVVPHEEGSHPELDEHDIRQFVVDFGGSGTNRGMLISEKYAPFEIYDRERRDGRIRFVTRERLPGFIDALAMR